VGGWFRASLHRGGRIPGFPSLPLPSRREGRLEFGHFSPRSGRECVAQGKSAQPWVSMRLLTVSPRSGRQKKLQIRDVRKAAAARCAGLAANVPTSPGLRRLALGYTRSPATRVPPTPLVNLPSRREGRRI
jgi:hypothetical protein